VRQHFNKLALILVLGSGFAIAQSSPQQPQGSSPSTPQTQPTDQQQPSTAPATDQNKTPDTKAPDTMPSTDQKKDDSTKMPQSDAAPAAASGDVQGNIQSAIQKDPTLSTANVNVAVNGKTVELTGTVPNKDAKDSAERIAKENAGGMKVKSHLKVASAGSDTAPPKTK
jgi:osmotically-inducible protein OsmY